MFRKHMQGDMSRCMSTIRAVQNAVACGSDKPGEEVGGKAGVTAYPQGLFHVVSKSCKMQRQCLTLVIAGKRWYALDRDGASLAFKVNKGTA